MKSKVWFNNVNRSDARKLVEWWNGHTRGRYFVHPHLWYKRRWMVVREQ